MEQEKMQGQHNVRDAVSRRGFLSGAAALAAAASVPSPLARGDDDKDDDKDDQKGNPREEGGSALLYIGCYTPNGSGINLFRMNSGNGALTPVTVVTGPGTSNPSWLALHPSKKYLYTVNENSPGTVSAFSIDASGNLSFLNAQSSGGNGPAHMSVDPSGNWALVANYGSGNVAVIQIDSTGHLGLITDNQNDNSACSPACMVGPTHAVKAPPGSFAVSGHDAPHAHMIQTDPTGNFVVVNDLGLDLTIIWAFDKVNGKLSSPKTFPSSAGAGPRHFVFHPNGKWFYSLNEEASTLAFMTYDATHGSLSPIVAEVQTLPAAFVGTNFTSELRVSADGRFLYAANRLHDTIAVFSVQGNGAPKLIGEESTRGDYPRSFTIDPTGRFMYVCNQRGDSVTTLQLDRDGGSLDFTGRYTAVGSPAVVVFL
jgi:6-phosphogluconolactonase (cycloisomerase 2 family)